MRLSNKEEARPVRITAIKDLQGEWKHSDQAILDAAKNYFENLFQPPELLPEEDCINIIKDANIIKMSDCQLEILNKPF